MSTGYTREQLRQFEILIAQNLPPAQIAGQLDGAPVVADAGLTGTDKGALIRLGFAPGAVNHFFLNCVVARRWVVELDKAAQEQGWPVTVLGQKADEDCAVPSDAQIWDAYKVLSLRTDSAPDGALVSFSSGRTVAQFFLPTEWVHAIVAGLHGLAMRGDWWDGDLRLVPADDGTKT